MTTEEYNKKYYERLFFRPKPNSQRIRTHLQELLAHKPGGSLLEIGCGRGEFLTLAKKHFDVHGMDISPYAVRVASDRLNGRIHQGNIESETLAANRYDAVVAFNVLEHLKRPERAIQKVFRGLHSDGVLMGSVPLNYALLGKIHTALTNLFDRTHVSTFPPKVWQRLFEEAGFQVVSFFGELNLGQNRHVYMRGRLWPYASFNLMFVCRK